MNNKLLLSMAVGLLGATPLMAANVDVYITGSTAFRANVHDACKKLFTTGTGTQVFYGDGSHGGSSTTFNNGTASWAMTGTPIAQLTNLAGNTLTIHGLFTGSVQGMQTAEQTTPLVFANADGTAAGNCSTYRTNTPTIGFSDASSFSTPYPVSGTIIEENVCVQPFVMCKSSATAGGVTNIGNVSWEQLEYGIPQGRIPYSAWSGSINDTNKFVYILQRTLDSGTRRCLTAGNYFQYGDTVGVYIWDHTNHFFFQPSVLAASGTGMSPNGVVGSAGLNSVNLNWGFGYVAGGDIRTALSQTDPANQSIACLSIGDAKTLNTPWGNVVSFNGFWPTAAGIGIRTNASSPNDFSPIILGYYPLWGYEVLVYNSTPAGDQNISAFQLGGQTSPGSFLGVFNAQTLINGGSPLTGSIENEIELSKPTGATAIRLSEMVNSRASVGATISPPFP